MSIAHAPKANAIAMLRHRTRLRTFRSTAWQRSRDRVENVVRVPSDQRNGGDTNNGDQRQHERVLDHRRGFVILDEVANHRGETVHLLLLGEVKWMERSKICAPVNSHPRALEPRSVR